MVARGAPRFLGVGFGEGQAKLTNECMFGARLQLPGAATLQQVLVEGESLAQLAKAMAKVKPPKSAGPVD